MFFLGIFFVFCAFCFPLLSFAFLLSSAFVLLCFSAFPLLLLLCFSASLLLLPWLSASLFCFFFFKFLFLLLAALPCFSIFLLFLVVVLLQKEIPCEIAFAALFEGGPLVANGKGAAPPPPNPRSLLSREEMNKHVFSNTREGESHTKTLQGVKREENEIIVNETSSPTDKKAKARRIRWGVKKQENKVQ